MNAKRTHLNGRVYRQDFGEGSRYSAPSSIMELGAQSLKFLNAIRDYVEALGRALGCENVVVQLDDDSFVDATLIIGRDHGRLNLSE